MLNIYILLQIYRIILLSQKICTFFFLFLSLQKEIKANKLMQIDHNSSKPLHAQAEEILRNLIDSEEYKTGKYLPNEVELSQKR